MKTLFKNIFFVSFGESGSRILSFLTTILLIRVFSVEDYGYISIATAIYGYAVLLSVHWLNPFGIKKISSGENADFVTRLTSIRFILALFALIIIIVITLLLDSKSDLQNLVFYFSLSLIPSAFFLDWYFQAKENLKPVALGKLIIASTYFLFCVVALYFKKSVVLVGLAFLFANMICALYLGIDYLKQNKIMYALSIRKWSTILKESLPLSLATVLSQLNVNLPILLIGIFLGAYDAGIFSAAYKLIFFLLMLDRYYYSIFFPAFTRIYNSSKELTEVFFNTTLRITMILLIFVAMLCLIFAEPLITLIFGVEYINSAFVFKLLIFYFIFTIMNSVFSFSLIAIGEERYYLRVIVISLISNAILLFSLINIYGVVGAALSIVLVEFFIMISMIIRFKRFFELKIKKYILQLMALAGIVSIITLYMRNINEIFSVIVGTTVYITGIFLIRLISNNDWTLLKDKIWT
ncbi:MAG: hypothetical protein IGBAC_0342 [Ignavibacteriae bacterium]|nr:MAG: hypothetical protein IGBAC_0342 [Ignavibacteriota bacterium]